MHTDYAILSANIADRFLNSVAVALTVFLSSSFPGHGMGWSERRILVWKIKDAKDGKERKIGIMEDSLLSFHLNSIIQLFAMAYKFCGTKLNESIYIISLLELK